MKKILTLMQSDMQQAKLANCQDGFSLAALFKLFFFRTGRIIALVRLSQTKGAVAWLCRYFLRKRFIEIGKIDLGSHFFLPHPQSIIIASGVSIGSNVHIGQYVTIGGNFKKTKTLSDGTIQKLPIIGNRVMIHPGAVIGGPVTIGDDVIIGANSVVTKDVPSNTIVFGQNQFSEKKISIPPQGGYYEVISTQ